MASYTIEPRPRADGSTRNRTTVRVKEHGVIVYRESCTFSKRTPAKPRSTVRVSLIEENGIPKDGDKPCSVGPLIQKLSSIWQPSDNRYQGNVSEGGERQM